MYSYEEICAIAIKMAFPYKPVLARQCIDAAGSAAGFFSLTGSGRDDLLSEISPNAGSAHKELSNPNLLLDTAAAEVKWCREKEIKIHYFREDNFPAGLLQIPDPPVVLFSYGRDPGDYINNISIVGTRKPSSYGLEITRQIVNEIARLNKNAVIVSGLAFGIDIEAHKSALSNKLHTIAVLPGPMDHIYPASHRTYASKIASEGCILSDFTRGSVSYKINFISRNRIIAALSAATILVESGIRGGGLITARFASSYSRELFAVPGRLSDRVSEGCNSLIGENCAQIYLSGRQFASQIGWPQSSRNNEDHIIFYEPDDVKRKILVSLNNVSDLTSDQISALIRVPPASLAVHLLELELERKIVCFSGNRYRINLLR
jgi:DNA processing protein